MHSHKRGKSGSHRVIYSGPPPWMPNLKPGEVEDLVVKLASEGYGPSAIGRILRDAYGIPSVRNITGKKISKILLERDVKFSRTEDLDGLVAKAERMVAHLTKNRSDRFNVHNLQLVESKIRRLASYYSREGVPLPDLRILEAEI
ncbi:MAG: 30S ribosomal protein S15 [Thermoproteota archaeon]